MELRIEITDRSAIVRVVNLTKDMARNLRSAMQKGLNYYRDRVVKNITSGKYGIKTKSGRLRGSMETAITGTGLNLKGFVGTNLIYAAIHEFGGVITAKRAPYLVFQVAGNWVRTKTVKIKRKEYMKRTLVAEKGKILRIMAQELLRV
jgi:phage gpG-like protein